MEERAWLLDPAGRMVPALVQYQAGRFPVAVGFKGDLRINYLQEEVVVAFRKHFHLPLSCRLRKHVISLASHGENKIRRKFRHIAKSCQLWENFQRQAVIVHLVCIPRIRVVLPANRTESENRDNVRIADKPGMTLILALGALPLPIPRKNGTRILKDLNHMFSSDMHWVAYQSRCMALPRSAAEEASQKLQSKRL
jgi:hypothetical protein